MKRAKHFHMKRGLCVQCREEIVVQSCRDPLPGCISRESYVSACKGNNFVIELDLKV